MTQQEIEERNNGEKRLREPQRVEVKQKAKMVQKKEPKIVVR